MRFHHFVITRFSYRGDYIDNWIMRDADPLDKRRLKFRMILFQISCLPAIMSQTNQDFDWILIVDKDLPLPFFERLRELVEPRKRTFFHEFQPGQDLSGVAWLKPYLKVEPHYLITTNCDDDDALPARFVEALQIHIENSSAERAPIPPFKVLASKNTLQWDIFFSEGRPLGMVAPWHKKMEGQAFPTSCGFSLLCKYPDFPYSLYKLRHPWGEFVFDDRIHKKELSSVRQEIKSKVLEQGHSWNNWTKEVMFYDVGSVTNAVVVLNHLYNDQSGRFFEKKEGAVTVKDANSFPGVSIDLRIARENANFLRQTLKIHLGASIEKMATRDFNESH